MTTLTGSGTGSLTFAIANQMGRARIVGIDPSQEYVAYAITRNPFADRASFELAGHFTFPHGIENSAIGNHTDIFVCRSPREPWHVFWKRFHWFG